MNEHVELSKEPLDEVCHVAERAGGDSPLFFQTDDDYPVDPLDDFPEINAFGSASALDEAERLERERLSRQDGNV